LHCSKRLAINQLQACLYSNYLIVCVEGMFNEKATGSEIAKDAAMKLRNAVAFESAGKYESALASIEEALAIQENYVDAWLVKGVIYGKLGRCSEAIKCYDKIIEIDSSFGDAWRLKAATYTSLSRDDKAAECLTKAVELNPTNLEFRLSLAIALQRLKKFEEALRCYEVAKKQRPDDPRIDYYIGLMWANMADYQKALSYFENALLIKADFTDALLAKGIMLARLDRKDEAKQCADKILELKGGSEKQQATQNQSLNASIRDQFNASQRKFSAKFAPPSNKDDEKRQ
jgi:tetratricopeptide (TPR) repeat protein